jgi:exopolysaccharide biosynthesis polyprenyl glycosylphosphotransferase
MLKQHDRELHTLLLMTDVGLCVGVFTLCLGLAGVATPLGVLGSWRLLLLGALAAGALPAAIRALEGRQTRLESMLAAARNLLLAGAIAAVVLAAAAFVLSAPVGPWLLLQLVAGQLLAVGLLRLSILGGLRGLRRRGRNYRNILVLGTGPRAREFTDTLDAHPEWGLRLIGYVDEGDCPLDPSIPSARVFKLIDFPDLLRDEVVDEVITACPRSMLANIGPAVEACSAAGVPLTVMTDLFGEYLPPPRVKRFGAHAALSFAPVQHGVAKLAVKRLFDVLGAALGLAVAAPVLAVAAVAIRVTSSGPILFRQLRCGVHGRPFVMYKLRTMGTDAEARRDDLTELNEMSGPVFKMKQDPRITPIGRLLRTFSIDELPQLWNVLVGDMSLVGPRPPLPAEVAQYDTAERRRLSMRPGLTCLWQITGRNSIGFDEWVKLDLKYIDGWSLASDLKILFLTIPVVFQGDGR